MRSLIVLLLLGFTSCLWAQEAEQDSPLERRVGESRDECLLRAFELADESVTLDTLKSWCGVELTRKEESINALRARLHLEENSRFNPFVVTPHHRNYIMPASYWSNKQWNNSEKEDGTLNSVEAKFQISLKVPIKTKVFHFYDIYFAYTQTNFFQVYNEDQSRPFRETNYMPELYATRSVDWQIGPFDSEQLAFGYVHQSNGKDIPASRSWDRLFLHYVARTGNTYWQLKPWWRIPENKKHDLDSPKRDDNPDIEKYLGNFELTITKPYGNQVIELMIRNNLRRHTNRGAVQVDYTFPLKGRFKGIFQVFSGYGDSLINYNDYQNRVSLGILLTDTL